MHQKVVDIVGFPSHMIWCIDRISLTPIVRKGQTTRGWANHARTAGSEPAIANDKKRGYLNENTDDMIDVHVYMHASGLVRVYCGLVSLLATAT